MARWGGAQWLRYYRVLAGCLDRIAGDPAVGRDRRLFRARMRSLNCQACDLFHRGWAERGDPADRSSGHEPARLALCRRS
ncbi:MAG: hypothetical protein Q4G49_17455 [Paracoccus sp. (in: a-proteobacteria)]|nr:hypothetical protein [Paracoccus sp. (in: a-proteobacteria)]